MMKTPSIFRTLIVVLMPFCLSAGSVSTAQETGPSIMVQPRAVDVAIGAAATFKVEALGNKLKYQWKKDGVVLIEEYDSSYSIPAISVGDAGSKISVTVSNTAGSVDSQDATISVHQWIQQREPKAYLTLNQLDVRDFPVVALSASVVDGPDLKINVGSDGIVRYLSPEEQYRDTVTTVAFKTTQNNFRYLVPMAWKSQSSPSINAISEDENSSASSLTVQMEGGGRAGYIHEGVAAVTYVLQSPKQISIESSEISIETKASTFDVTGWFDIKPEAGTLKLKNEYMPQFKKTMKKSGFASLVFSLSTQNYEDTYGFESTLQYAGVSLTVKVVDAQGECAPSALGEQYVVTGLNTELKVLSTVRAGCDFVVDDLPIDTYSVEKVLLEPGSQVVGFYPFDRGATDGVLTLVTRSPAKTPTDAAVASFTDKVSSETATSRQRDVVLKIN